MTPTPTPETPRCNMCPRPARRDPNFDGFHMYCAGRSCSNRERFCRSCGDLYSMHSPGAGTKYCSTECKTAGYGAGSRTRTIKEPCAWCGAMSPDPVYAHRPGGWPYVCPPCTDPYRHVIPRLKAHKVNAEQAHLLLSDPSCRICGVDVVTKERRADGTIRSLLVVDHNHACCPGSTSCGECVRGILCIQCNSALGMLKDSPDVALAAYHYLAA